MILVRTRNWFVEITLFQIIITTTDPWLQLEDAMFQLARWNGYPFSSTNYLYVTPNKGFQCFWNCGIFSISELDSEYWSYTFGYIFIQIDMDKINQLDNWNINKIWTY